MLEQVSPFLAFKTPAIEYAAGEHTGFVANLRHRPVELTKMEKMGEQAGIEAREKYRKHTEAGWGTGPIIDSFAGATSYAGSEYRQPMQEKTKINDIKVSISQLGETNESIHPVIAWRIEKLKNAKTKYAPEGLKKWKRQVNKDKNGFEYVNVEAKLTLPEYVIRDVHGPSVERQALLAVEDAQAWLAGVDKVTGGAKSEAT
jgi:hypothetical protein